MVKLVSEIGPDIPEIARRLGQYKESVRYRYKEKVLSKGFGVQAFVDHDKLGLRRIVMLLEFSPVHTQYAHSILAAMNELCYVVYFEKRMFRGDFLVDASVPAEHVQAFIHFMTVLKEKGMFKSFEAIPFERYVIAPMCANAYDFDTGRWDFNWSAPLKSDGRGPYAPPEKAKFDTDDLLILKELQIDATRSFVEVAKKLKANYKMLSWHYKVHVLERKMIAGYYLRWMGTTYSTVLEKALHRKHRYQHLAILATRLNQVERMMLMGRMHGLPFLWNEMTADESYCAHFYFPTENITEAYQYLTTAIAEVKDRVEVLPLDQTEALSFTISYKLYDQKKKQWTFDEQSLISRFSSLIEKTKEIGGS